MQAKATPIREAVVVIDEFTTMDDLKNLSDRFLERFRNRCFSNCDTQGRGVYQRQG